MIESLIHYLKLFPTRKELSISLILLAAIAITTMFVLQLCLALLLYRLLVLYYDYSPEQGLLITAVVYIIIFTILFLFIKNRITQSNFVAEGYNNVSNVIKAFMNGYNNKSSSKRSSF